MTKKAAKRQGRRKALRRNGVLPLILIMLAAAAVLFYLSQDKRIGGTGLPERDFDSASEAGQDDFHRPSAPEDSALYFGNPSGARADASLSTNYLMEKAGYSLSYNAELLIPNWVMWHLCAADLGGAGRGKNFRADSALPQGWYAVADSDYQYFAYGFDRGHLCPSADRTSSAEGNEETFLMTNMIPQAPDCNRIVWKGLEDYERRLAKGGMELYIAAGPHGAGGTGAAGFFESIALPPKKNAGSYMKRGAISVPAACWKIILVLEDGGEDFSRVTKETTAIAVFIPNSQGISGARSWTRFLTTVDDIEEKTGFDFFSSLPDEIESAIEARKYEVPAA